MNRFCILIFLLLLPLLISAQRQVKMLPLSFSNEFQAQYSPTIPIEKVAKPSKERIAKQTAQSSNFSIPKAVNIELGKAGIWTEMSNGDRLWQLEVHSKDALALILMYDDFYLPRGSRLFVYSSDHQQVLGAYTSQNNNVNKRFLTGMIKGEAAIVEYYEPAEVRGQGSFRIFRIDYIFEKKIAYSDHPFQQMNGLGFGASAVCQRDVACEEKEEIDKIKRGVCRIMMVLEEGTGWCTGNLVNTTAQDGRPLVLSAYHCFDGYTPLFDLWRFDFNYEHTSCGENEAEPDFQSLLGGQLRAFWADADFSLLEINQNIPSSYNAYFNGWDARPQSSPATSTFIHHPRADVKKVTLDESPVFVFPLEIEWNNDFTTPPNHHFSLAMNEGGGFEVGSSGGALFDENQRIVGQLHGGFPDTLCRNSTAYFGRLAMSWKGGEQIDRQLETWLDPLNTGELLLDGIENPMENALLTLSGKVSLPDGRGIANVAIKVGEETRATTDLAGNFLLENMEVGKNYEIAAFKDDGIGNGISVTDLLLILNHNLGRELFTSSYQIIAADVNNSKSLTIFDLVELQKVNLGSSSRFPNNTSWRFLPTSFDATDVENFDFDFPERQQTLITPNSPSLNFFGVKIGDVNDSVDPSK
ncbi:MAG: hypothetical protein AAF849_21265 [Bacteroidota bacterium]